MNTGKYAVNSYSMIVNIIHPSIFLLAFPQKLKNDEIHCDARCQKFGLLCPAKLSNPRARNRTSMTAIPNIKYFTILGTSDYNTIIHSAVVITSLWNNYAANHT